MKTFLIIYLIGCVIAWFIIKYRTRSLEPKWRNIFKRLVLCLFSWVAVVAAFLALLEIYIRNNNYETKSRSKPPSWL